MESEPDVPDPDEVIARHVRAARRTRVGAASFLALSGVLVGTVALAGDRLAHVARGETDLAGHFVYRPVAPDRTALVDLEAVHARLVPDWVIAEANAETGVVTDRRRAERAFAALRDALAPDANLVSLAEALHESFTSRDRLGEAARVQWISWAWNEYLDRARVPLRLEVGLRIVTRGVLPWSRSYRVTVDVRTARGRARLVSRVDRTNVVEPYLGHSSPHGDGAIVVVDRVLAFAAHDVWPALDPVLDRGHHDARVRALAPFVRGELEHALSQESLALLRSSAIDEARLVDTIDAIHARRRCGSPVVIRDIPFHELSSATAASIVDALAHPNATCPRVTRDEARTIWEVSARLQRTAGLEAALSELVAWVARGVALHELRHVDDLSAETTSPCNGLDDVACDEARAYLASFADERSGYVSLLASCQLLTSRWRGAGANEDALVSVAHELLPNGCTGTIPSDVPARAARLSVTSYGTTITRDDLGASFPNTVPLFL